MDKYKMFNSAYQIILDKLIEKEKLLKKHNIIIKNENGEFLPLLSIVFQLELHWEEIEKELKE